MKLVTRSLLLFVAPLLVPTLWSCSVQNQEKKQDQPVIELSEFSGESIDLSALKGKTVFINVWATWCAPCIREMPSIENAKKSLGDRVQIFMASEEEPENVRRFLKQRDFDLDFVRLENGDALGLTVLPATYIINPSGKISFFEVGARKWDDPENIELVNNIAKGL